MGKRSRSQSKASKMASAPSAPVEEVTVTVQVKAKEGTTTEKVVKVIFDEGKRQSKKCADAAKEFFGRVGVESSGKDRQRKRKRPASEKHGMVKKAKKAKLEIEVGVSSPMVSSVNNPDTNDVDAKRAEIIEITRKELSNVHVRMILGQPRSRKIKAENVVSILAFLKAFVLDAEALVGSFQYVQETEYYGGPEFPLDVLALIRIMARISKTKGGRLPTLSDVNDMINKGRQGERGYSKKKSDQLKGVMLGLLHYGEILDRDFQCGKYYGEPKDGPGKRITHLYKNLRIGVERSEQAVVLQPPPVVLGKQRQSVLPIVIEEVQQQVDGHAQLVIWKGQQGGGLQAAESVNVVIQQPAVLQRIVPLTERVARPTSSGPSYMDQDQYSMAKSLETASYKYMEDQPHINEDMRAILVDWLVEVHLKFKLVPETLYLTIDVMDRYLAQKEVTRSKLQLVGITALLLASKYEEVYPPELRDLVYICDNAYTREQIIDMEKKIGNTLQHRLTIQSSCAFLYGMLNAIDVNEQEQLHQLSCYILDGTLLSYNLLHFLPSQLAAAAVYIARHSVGHCPWSLPLCDYSGYKEKDVKPVAQVIIQEKLSAKSLDLNNVTNKYSKTGYGGVANIPLDGNF